MAPLLRLGYLCHLDVDLPDDQKAFVGWVNRVSKIKVFAKRTVGLLSAF